MSVMFCTGATFVKKNSYLVARIVSFDTVSLHLLTFHILQPYPSKDILTLMSPATQVNYLKKNSSVVSSPKKQATTTTKTQVTRQRKLETSNYDIQL